MGKSYKRGGKPQEKIEAKRGENYIKSLVRKFQALEDAGIIDAEEPRYTPPRKRAPRVQGIGKPHKSPRTQRPAGKTAMIDVIKPDVSEILNDSSELHTENLHKDYPFPSSSLSQKKSGLKAAPSDEVGEVGDVPLRYLRNRPPSLYHPRGDNVDCPEWARLPVWKNSTRENRSQELPPDGWQSGETTVWNNRIEEYQKPKQSKKENKSVAGSRMIVVFPMISSIADKKSFAVRVASGEIKISEFEKVRDLDIPEGAEIVYRKKHGSQGVMVYCFERKFFGVIVPL